MKGFLTFTLAAGVAITTTSVAQAEGVVKGAASGNLTAPAMLAPQGLSAMGMTLDRMALNRELARLTDLLTANESVDESATAPATPITTKSLGTWTY